jgi:hypothetical protein
MKKEIAVIGRAFAALNLIKQLAADEMRDNPTFTKTDQAYL